MYTFRRFSRFLTLSLLITPAFAQNSVLTYHNDNLRTGQNLNETSLTPQNVQFSTFGKLFTLAVDGKVDAQPLVAAGVSIPTKGVHNVVFVATEHDSVYAFDADTGAPYWQVSMLKTAETTSDTRGCSQVSPEIGITATPVIDLTAGPHGTIYVVAMSKDSGGGYHQRLHALDITTGAEQFSGPVEIQAVYPGTGDNSSGGNVVFDPKQYKARPGLLLVNGVVYTSWSSHCDIRPYTGWTIGYNQTTLAQTNVFNFTPNGNEAAVWGAGAGASADLSGNLFFQLGNGTFDTTLDGSGFPSKGDFGNAFVKVSLVSGALKAVDYWTMFNTVAESNADQDLGSGGVLLLPDLVDANGQTRHLGVGAGKDRNVYLFDRDNMGKFNPSTNGNIYQVLTGALGGSEFASPAWFNGLLYFGSVGDVIRAYKMTTATLATSPWTSTTTTFAFPGTTPSISANGTSNAILWAVENSNPAKLHAYDANDLLTELYNSSQAPGSRDQFGAGNKFMTPTIVNGKVYVGTPNSVAVFGILPTSQVPTLTSVTPSSGAQGAAVNVTLTGTNFISGATVGASGTGLTVTNVVVVSATQITATFTVAPTATTGTRNISVTTTAGTSNTQTFTVNAGLASPTITKGFNPASISSGGSSTVTLTLSNSNASALAGGAFSDTLANMSASGGAVGGTCAGTTPATLTAGSTNLSFTGIAIPASSSCTVTFGVTSSHLGSNPNTTSGVTTTQTPTAGAASNTANLSVASAGGGLNDNFESGAAGWTMSGQWHLTNNSACPAPSPGYSSPTHAFYYGQDASCNYQTGSTANSGDLTSPAISGITAQSTLQFSYFLNTEGTAGFDTATVFVVPAGGNPTQLTTVSTNDNAWHAVTPVSLSQFAGQTIQIRFTFNTVDGIANGFKGWFVDDVVVTGGSVQPVSPTVAKGFNPASIAAGGNSLVTLTLSNSNASGLTGGALSDTLTNMSAVGGAVGGTCLGTTPSSLTAGATSLNFTGIAIPANSSCTITFNVTSSHNGANPNTTSGVTTTQTPTAGPASNTAMLTVSAIASPTISKGFNPTSIAAGGNSLVTLTLSNSNASALTGGAFSDTLTNMSAVGGAVGGSCAGTTPASLSVGATSLNFTGITIPASSSCTVTFSVTSNHTGSNPNTSSGVTTTQTPAAGAASNTANLSVATVGSGLNDNLESGAAGWTTTGLWHLANSSACPAPALGYSSPTHAFYYGQDGSCNYATGTTANTGDLTSPPVSGITAQSTLQFSYFLNTEGTAGFDTAAVFVVPSGGNPIQLTTITTNDASWHTITPVSLSQFAGQTIQIRFTFNTVDGIANNFKGWFIDDVVVATGSLQTASPTIVKTFSPTSIAVGGNAAVTLTVSNSNASALTGAALTDTLTNMSAVGGAVTGTCVGTTPSTLTAGATSLAFTGITIPASSSCTVIFSVTSSHLGNNPNTTSGVTTTQTPTAGPASNTASLSVGSTGGGLNDNLESGAAGWTATGLWHLANNSACAAPSAGYASATHAFYYGQDSSCDYNTGDVNSGSLTSPPVSGITAQSTLQFSYFLKTEGTAGFDTANVYVVVGGNATPLTTISTNDNAWHTTSPISLSQFAGQTIQIRFTFNSVDGIANNFKGWFVDDVIVGQ